MKISIIIPTYNVEAYIEECLESVAAQTWQGELECIVVDDCSSDSTIQVIKAFIENYKGKIQFTLLQQKENQRQGAARNVGLKLASGDYVLFVDSDDTITPDCLEIMTDGLKKYPKADYVMCNISDMHNHHHFASVNYPEYVKDRQWLQKKMLFPEGGIAPGVTNKLIRLSLIIENGLYFPQRIIYEDVQFSFFLGLYVKAACFIPKVTYFYRTNREGGTINSISKNVDFRMMSRLTIMNNIITHLTCFRHDIAFKALVARYLLYLKITDEQTLDKYTKELQIIKNKIVKESSICIPQLIMHLPLKVLRQPIINKIVYRILK